MIESTTHLSPARARLRSAAIYTGPDDVVADASLSIADKRAILASWVSDARAVENAPTLRRLDSGAVVEVAAVLAALRGLDHDQRRGVVVRFPLRAGRRGDEDDDPPPTPVRAGLPVPPIDVFAYGGDRRLAAAGA